MKVNDKKFMVLDDLNIETSKTKDLLKILTILDINNEKIIILSSEENKSIYFSSRNLINVKSKNVNSFSTCDVADSSFLLMDKVSVEYLNEKLV